MKKTLRKEGQKYSWARKVVFLLQMLIPIFNCKCKDLQGGTLCGPVFFICLKDFNKENSFFEQGKVIDLVRVRFVFLLLKSMQSQFKTIQPQLKTLREKGQKSAIARKVVFFIASANFNFKLQMQGPARGYPLWTCFLAIFFKDFNKENSSFEKGKVIDLVRVRFVFLLLKSMQSQFKTIQPQLKTLREKGQKSAIARKVGFFYCKC